MALTYTNKQQPFKFNHTDGFALPTVLIASIVMLSVLMVAIASTAAVRVALAAQYYNQMAQNAADAGAAYARACLLNSDGKPTWQAPDSLRPDTDCNGKTISGIDKFVVENDKITSSFTVSPVPAGQLDSNGRLNTIHSAGVVDLLRASDGASWRKYKQNSHISMNDFSLSSVKVETIKIVINGSAFTPNDGGAGVRWGSYSDGGWYQASSTFNLKDYTYTQSGVSKTVNLTDGTISSAILSWEHNSVRVDSSYRQTPRYIQTDVFNTLYTINYNVNIPPKLYTGYNLINYLNTKTGGNCLINWAADRDSEGDDGYVSDLSQPRLTLYWTPKI